MVITFAALAVPRNGPDDLKNHPGSTKKSGIYVPKSGRYGCIFIQKRHAFCINIQPPVNVFRHSCHGYSNGKVKPRAELRHRAIRAYKRGQKYSRGAEVPYCLFAGKKRLHPMICLSTKNNTKQIQNI